MRIAIASYLNILVQHFLAGTIIFTVSSAIVNAQDIAASPVGSIDNHVEESLTRELLVWIKENSNYDVTPVTNDLPEIIFCECGEVIEYEGQSITIHASIKGLLDAHEYKIILIKPWNAADFYNVSTLLHELTHIVQFRSKKWTCPKEPEWEAYKLQAKWLGERGIDPKFNWAQILLNSSCTIRDIHP